MASKSVRDIQVFLGFTNSYQRFILGFSRIATPLTSMLKTAGSTESTTRPGKGGVGVGGGFALMMVVMMMNIHLEAQGSASTTHQLVRPGLWSSMMRLVVVASRSKSCQKVENASKSQKLQRSEKFAKVIGSEKRLLKH